MTKIAPSGAANSTATDAHKLCHRHNNNENQTNADSITVIATSSASTLISAGAHGDRSNIIIDATIPSTASNHFIDAARATPHAVKHAVSTPKPPNGQSDDPIEPVDPQTQSGAPLSVSESTTASAASIHMLPAACIPPRNASIDLIASCLSMNARSISSSPFTTASYHPNPLNDSFCNARSSPASAMPAAISLFAQEHENVLFSCYLWKKSRSGKFQRRLCRFDGATLVVLVPQTTSTFPHGTPIYEFDPLESPHMTVHNDLAASLKRLYPFCCPIPGLTLSLIATAVGRNNPSPNLKLNAYHAPKWIIHTENILGVVPVESSTFKAHTRDARTFTIRSLSGNYTFRANSAAEYHRIVFLFDRMMQNEAKRPRAYRNMHHRSPVYGSSASFAAASLPRSVRSASAQGAYSISHIPTHDRGFSFHEPASNRNSMIFRNDVDWHQWSTHVAAQRQADMFQMYTQRLIAWKKLLFAMISQEQDVLRHVTTISCSTDHGVVASIGISHLGLHNTVLQYHRPNTSMACDDDDDMCDSVSVDDDVADSTVAVVVAQTAAHPDPNLKHMQERYADVTQQIKTRRNVSHHGELFGASSEGSSFIEQKIDAAGYHDAQANIQSTYHTTRPTSNPFSIGDRMEVASTQHLQTQTTDDSASTAASVGVHGDDQGLTALDFQSTVNKSTPDQHTRGSLSLGIAPINTPAKNDLNNTSTPVIVRGTKFRHHDELLDQLSKMLAGSHDESRSRIDLDNSVKIAIRAIGETPTAAPNVAFCATSSDHNDHTDTTIPSKAKVSENLPKIFVDDNHDVVRVDDATMGERVTFSPMKTMMDTGTSTPVFTKFHSVAFSPTVASVEATSMDKTTADSAAADAEPFSYASSFASSVVSYLNVPDLHPSLQTDVVELVNPHLKSVLEQNIVQPMRVHSIVRSVYTVKSSLLDSDARSDLAVDLVESGSPETRCAHVLDHETASDAICMPVASPMVTVVDKLQAVMEQVERMNPFVGPRSTSLPVLSRTRSIKSDVPGVPADMVPDRAIVSKSAPLIMTKTSPQFDTSILNDTSCRVDEVAPRTRQRVTQSKIFRDIEKIEAELRGIEHVPSVSIDNEYSVSRLSAESSFVTLQGVPSSLVDASPRGQDPATASGTNESGTVPKWSTCSMMNASGSVFGCNALQSAGKDSMQKQSEPISTNAIRPYTMHEHKLCQSSYTATLVDLKRSCDTASRTLDRLGATSSSSTSLDPFLVREFAGVTIPHHFRMMASYAETHISTKENTTTPCDSRLHAILRRLDHAMVIWTRSVVTPLLHGTEIDDDITPTVINILAARVGHDGQQYRHPLIYILRRVIADIRGYFQ